MEAVLSGCSWATDVKIDEEEHLKQHNKVKHFKSMQLPAKYASEFFDFYEAAIEWKAQQAMPSVGFSIDRRSLRLVNDVFNGDIVFSLICMVCAQSKPHTGLRSRRVDGKFAKLSEVQYRDGSLLQTWKLRNLDHFDNNFGFRTFMHRYGEEWKTAGCHDEDLQELGPTRWEWHRILLGRRQSDGFEILCCPEDIRCTQGHDPSDICAECEVPICTSCYSKLNTESDVPMALANDNMWGYVSSLIFEHKVRWIEMAAVLPYWTSMIVYYVEADRNHLMNEVMKENTHRTAVRGQAFSFLMSCTYCELHEAWFLYCFRIERYLLLV